MRFTCVKFDIEEEDIYYRFTDLVESGSAIQTEADLNDPYFEWIKEKGFQWYVEVDDEGYLQYTVVFYEEHPFFNCLLLRYLQLDEEQVYAPLFIVEKWLIRMHNNYKRRQRRKVLKN